VNLVIGTASVGAETATASPRELDAILAAGADGLVVWGPDRRARRWNRAAARLLGVDMVRLGERSLDDPAWGWTDTVGAPLAPAAHPVARALSSGQPLVGATLGVRSGGELRRLRCTAYPYRQGGSTAVVLALRLDEATLAGEVDLARRATTDALTGLPNRALLLDRLEQMLRHARRTNQRVSVLYCDLDHFKQVNDDLGHAAGDDVLVEVGARLGSVVREGDTVARLGGDEFVIACPDLGPHAAESRLAGRVRATVSAPLEVEARSGRAELRPTVSIGVAGSEPGDEPPEILRRADLAMYQAKDEGRDRARLFDATLRRSSSHRHRLEAELVAAVERDELVVDYRPVVDLADGRVVGARAVVGWDHPGRGRLPPEEFLPLAEQIGLVRTIGRRVLEVSLADLATWRSAAGEDLFVAVGASTRELAAEGIHGYLAPLLEASGVPASAVVVELGEGVVLDRRGSPLAKARALADLGVRLALEGFGAGASPLSALTEVPLDLLELDPRLMRGIAHDHRRRELARALVTLARGLGLVVVAHGVDADATLRAARDLGCPLGQGSHLGRLCSAGEMGELVAGHRPRRAWAP